MGLHKTDIIFDGSIRQTRYDIIIYYRPELLPEISSRYRRKHTDQLTDFMTVYRPFIYIFTMFGFMKWIEINPDMTQGIISIKLRE